MTSSNHIMSSATAFCICIAFYATSAFLWGFIAAHNPLTLWLVASFGTDYPALSTFAVSVHDILVTALIAYPFALLLIRLPKRAALLGLALSVPALVAWQVVPFLAGSPISIQDVVLSLGFWLPAIALVLSLVVVGRRSPDGAPSAA